MFWFWVWFFLDWLVGLGFPFDLPPHIVGG